MGNAQRVNTFRRRAYYRPRRPGNSFKSELWTGELLKSAPDQIRDAHAAFVKAGAQIIITSTYQISFPGCIAKGWSHDEVVDALNLSVQLARDARAPKVAASIGPFVGLEFCYG